MNLAELAVLACVIVVFTFGGWAIYLSLIESKLASKDVDFFLSARDSISTSRIAWSFFSASVGAWVLFVPSSFAVDPDTGAGWLGLMNYAIFSSLPILFIAYTGQIIKNKYPQVLSISDYVRLRFGKIVESYVALLVLLNTGLALAAEYTAIGDLFEHVLGSSRMLPVLLVGTVTLIYTCVGGLMISILTDRLQSIFSVLLIGITCIYVLFTFKPNNLPPLPPHLALNEAGWSSFITLGIPLSAASFFSDAMWQRVWSSESDKSLKTGAVLGSIATLFVIFICGFFGFLATWNGQADAPSTSFFAILKEPGSLDYGWIIILVSVIAITLNESAVDSLQNGITSTIVAITFSMKLAKTKSIIYARFCSVLINIPIILLGLQGFKITSIYLIMNIFTSTSTLPMLLGLVPALDFYLSGYCALFGCMFSLLSVVFYGYWMTGDVFLGIYRYFFEIYAWQPFVIAIFCSALGMGIWIAIEIIYSMSMGLPYFSFSKHYQAVSLPEDLDGLDVKYTFDRVLASPEKAL